MLTKPARAGTSGPASQDRRRTAIRIAVIVVVLLILIPLALLAMSGGIGGHVVQVPQ